MGEAGIQPVRYAVVGLGMGRGRARQIKQEAEAGHPVELVAVCDRIAGKAEAVGDELEVHWTSSLTELLERSDIDVIYVVVETGNHARAAVAALDAGKHVLCTKPLEATMEAGAAMLAAAERNHCQLAVDFDWRHTSAASQRIKQAIAAGAFGRVLFGDVTLKVLRTDEYFAHNGGWRGTWALDGGGAMSNQGIHQLDQLYDLLGMPESVEGRIWTQNQNIEAEDLGICTWYYADGRAASFKATTCWPAPGWYDRVEIHGTKGAVIWQGSEEQWFLDGKWQDEPPEYAVDTRSATQRFARAVRLGEPMPVDGEEGLRSLAVLKAAYRSAEEQRPVSPRELLP